MSMYVGDGAKRVLQAQAEIVRTRGDKSVDVQIRKADGSIGEFVVTSKLMLGRNDQDHRLFGDNSGYLRTQGRRTSP